MKNHIRLTRVHNFLIYVFFVIGSLTVYGYRFPSNNNLVEVPPVLSLLDPKIYQNDYYVYEQVKPGPRYYYHLLVTTLARSGLDLSGSYFLLYFLSFSSFILGVYAIGTRFGKSRLAASFLSFLVLGTAYGTVGAVDLFRVEPIPAIFAMGLTVWGIYFCFCQSWLKGYFFSAWQHSYNFS
jgi:hypothetical protein